MAKRGLIGEILVEQGIITQVQLDEVLREQKRTNQKIGEIIVRNQFATEEDIAKILSDQLGFPFIDLSTYQVEEEVLILIPEEEARRLEVIPVFQIGQTLNVAMANPLNISLIDEITQLTGNLRIKSMIATPSGIRTAIDKFYGGVPTQKITPLQTPTSPQGPPQADKAVLEKTPSFVDDVEQAVVKKIVDQIIEDAVKSGASDIHLEPHERTTYCRMRIDGILHDVKPPPAKLYRAIVSRIKILAEMDIAQSRLPEDGRVQTNISGKEVDLRIATFPTLYGEHVSIRILDKSQGIMNLDQLGFQGDDLNKIKDLINRPHGMILVTGPTGTGKSTTLYAILNTINDLKKNIVTLEDPIEYTIPRVNQAQVNAKAGFTFATGLRSMLRLDPDIIMIGEIRDRETADIAIHAALTGHLVFSTLHTNDAAAAVARLVDIGIEPYLISASLLGVAAQRLVRKLCPKCKKEFVPHPSDWAGMAGTLTELEGKKIYRAEGCKACLKLGYKGRTSLFEIFLTDNRIKELIDQKAPAHEVKAAAQSTGMKTLQQNGIEKVLQGLTSLSEVLRVTRDV